MVAWNGHLSSEVRRIQLSDEYGTSGQRCNPIATPLWKLGQRPAYGSRSLFSFYSIRISMAQR
ncbi:hypothetical protein ZHAS_00020532 [Anopheles sinensis]|uniref:Uncharacterized protein n=1 Tax=Anopheles sinensis TaxID=74873 RepID=A0A084WQ06_ANOSI|nr:hypothetical protein ZHAS_00020532 [Anopheles sinensis]